MLEMTDRDYAHYLLGEDIDLDAQLLAIRDLMRRHSVASAELSREIDELADAARSAKGPYAEHLVDLSVDRMHNSVYQDAAHSMAAAGMLAPLMESVLVRLFDGIGHRPWPLIDSDRKNLADASEKPKAMWNAQIYFSSRRGPVSDVVKGVIQLARTSGLDGYLTEDFAKAFEALVTYRNKMFHNGFEWPVAMRDNSQTLIEQKHWEDWFSRASTNDKPWVFYMSAPFIERLMALIDEVLKAAGRLVRDRVAVYGFDKVVDVVPDAHVYLFEQD